MQTDTILFFFGGKRIYAFARNQLQLTTKDIT